LFWQSKKSPKFSLGSENEPLKMRDVGEDTQFLGAREEEKEGRGQ